MNHPAKHPLRALDYRIDWGGALLGRSVTDARWTVAPDEPGGLALTASAIEGTITSIRLEGGRPGRVYRVTGVASFPDGGEAMRSLSLSVGAPR